MRRSEVTQQQLKELADEYGLVIVTNGYTMTYDLRDLGRDAQGFPEHNGKDCTGKTYARIPIETYVDLLVKQPKNPALIGKPSRMVLRAYMQEQLDEVPMNIRRTRAPAAGRPAPTALPVETPPEPVLSAPTPKDDYDLTK